MLPYRSLSRLPGGRIAQARGFGQEKRQCAVCRCVLQHFEDVYCKSCNTVIEKRMHVKYRI